MSASPRQPAVDARTASDAPSSDPVPLPSPESVRPMLSHDIFALQGMGGVSRYAVELHQALRRLGVPSTVLAPLHRSDVLHNVGHVAGLRIPPRLRVRGTSRVALLAGQLAEPPILAVLRRRHPGLILHRTYYSARTPSRRTATVITVYDMAHELHRDSFSPDDPTTSRKRAWCNQADAILAISHYTKAQLISLFGIEPSRVIVSHPGVSIVAPDPQTLDALQMRRRPFLLYVGNRGGYKNFDRLASAYARSRALTEDIELVAFGGEAPSSSEHARLERLGISRHVSFARGGDAVLAAHYASTVALVYPSLDEGFGVPSARGDAPRMCGRGSGRGSNPRGRRRRCPPFRPDRHRLDDDGDRPRRVGQRPAGESRVARALPHCAVHMGCNCRGDSSCIRGRTRSPRGLTAEDL